MVAAHCLNVSSMDRMIRSHKCLGLSLAPISPTKTIYTFSREFRHRPDACRRSTQIREDSTVNSDDTTRTSATLLRRTSDWRDHAAWQEFVVRYDPLIQSWCREYRFDDDLAEDVSQLFWIEMADKMRSFRYDPSRRFRGWLRRCFHWRAVDAIRERSREELVVRSLDDPSCLDVECSLPASDQLDDEDDEQGIRRLLLLDLAEQVQAAVREKVHAQSWQVFWHISIDGWTTRETADALSMSYLAAHAAHKRVLDRLAAEGDRHLAELVSSNTGTRPSPP
jgi:RNA polymerase sigma factor (sigma-70 family)